MIMQLLKQTLDFIFITSLYIELKSIKDWLNIEHCFYTKSAECNIELMLVNSKRFLLSGNLSQFDKVEDTGTFQRVLQWGKRR